MQKKKRHGVAFWDQEYTQSQYLQMSESPSEDLLKFMRWLSRQKVENTVQHPKVLDLGCGNGRNLIYLAQHARARGIGYDSSGAAIKVAKKNSEGLPITYEVRSIAGDIDIEDNSQDFVLDMMTSHFLNEKERVYLRDEIFRVLKPGGWFYMKTFLGDGDSHVTRLLKESSAQEAGTYIHPIIGVPEHVYYEDELVSFLEEKFIIHQLYKSQRHRVKGKVHKRRAISIYAQKDPFNR